jgi:hypothetical protein
MGEGNRLPLSPTSGGLATLLMTAGLAPRGESDDDRLRVAQLISSAMHTMQRVSFSGPKHYRDRGHDSTERVPVRAERYRRFKGRRHGHCRSMHLLFASTALPFFLTCRSYP